ASRMAARAAHEMEMAGALAGTLLGRLELHQSQLDVVLEGALGCDLQGFLQGGDGLLLLIESGQDPGLVIEGALAVRAALRALDLAERVEGPAQLGRALIGILDLPREGLVRIAHALAGKPLEPGGIVAREVG